MIRAFNNEKENVIPTTSTMSLKSLVATSLLAGSVLGAAVEQASQKKGVKFGVERSSKVVESKSKFEKRDDGSKVLDFVIDNQQNFYTVNVSVGTPAQNVTVLLDTGSSDLWVLGDFNNVTSCEAYVDITYGNDTSGSGNSEKLAKNRNAIRDDTYSLSSGFDWSFTTDFGGSDETSTTTSGSTSATSTGSYLIDEILYRCDSMGVYAPGDSSTYQANTSVAPFMIQYADLTYAKGWWVKDTLAVNGVDVSLQFAVANVSNSTSILGVSYPNLESSSTLDNASFTYPNLPYVLKNQGLIDKVSYSLYLNNLEQPEGVLLFGAVDASKYTGQLYTVPLVNVYTKYYDKPIEFDITVYGVGFFAADGNKTTFTTTPLTGLLDSGTTYLYAPQELADAFAETVDAEWDEDIGYYVLECPSAEDAMGSLAFDLGGFIIYTPLDNYILTTSSETSCLLALATEERNFFILGDVFLASTYVVYDMEDYEISIAQANFAGANEENIKPIVSTVPGAIKAPLYSSSWTSQVTPLATGGNMFPSNATNPWTATSNNGKVTSSLSTTATTGSNVSITSKTTGSSVSITSKTTGSATHTSSATGNTSTKATSTTTKSQNAGVSLAPLVSGNVFAGLFVLIGSLL